METRLMCTVLEGSGLRMLQERSLPLKGPFDRERLLASWALEMHELEQKQRYGDGKVPGRVNTFK